MSHALASYYRKNKYQPGKVSNPFKVKITQLIDDVAPGLGKKVKSNLAHQIASTAAPKKSKKPSKIKVKKLVKQVARAIGDPSSFLDFNRVDMSLRGQKPSYYENNALSTGSSVGGVAMGGSTTYAPVAVSRNINRVSKPRMTSRNGGFVIAHSEMLGAILSGTPTSNVTAYRSVGFRANPGMSSVFPWLSTLAVNFEKYKFTRLSFTLVPLVSTSFNGRIGIGFDFDSSDAVPGTRQEFYSLSTHCENMPWQACGINVKCDGTLRFTGTHAAADNKLIDLGQVIVMSDAVSGGTISAAIPLYDLIVDYEVELFEPQQALFSTQSYNGNLPLTVGVALGTGADQTLVVGPTVITSLVPTSTIVLTASFPAGTYQISWFFNWSSGSPVVTPTTPTAGAGTKFTFFNPATTALGNGVLTCATEFTVLFTVTASTWTSLLNKCNFSATRVTSQVYANYVP